jgi:hypothetical protein
MVCSQQPSEEEQGDCDEAFDPCFGVCTPSGSLSAEEVCSAAVAGEYAECLRGEETHPIHSP